MSENSLVLSHITLGTNNTERAAAFYDAVLAVLGFTRVPKPEGKAPMYAKGEQLPVVYLYEPYDGNPATVGNGSHIAFLAETRSEVDQFYDSAMQWGGKDEGGPGVRAHYGPNYYATYVRDPDGNKIQAVCYADQ